MKTTINRLSHIGAICVLAAMGLSSSQTPLHADEGKNILKNGGFEMETTAWGNSGDERINQLFDQGVNLPNEREPMPKFLEVNPGEGWEDSQYSFKYLKGFPGRDVHSGSHAIAIQAPEESAILLSDFIPVHPPEENGGKGELITGKEYKYSFYAKGSGTVEVRLYMYGSPANPINIYDYETNQVRTPETHQVANESDWEEFTGTVMISSNEVGAVRFTIRAKGDVAIDDVQFFVE